MGQRPRGLYGDRAGLGKFYLDTSIMNEKFNAKASISSRKLTRKKPKDTLGSEKKLPGRTLSVV